jgi:hypothetical protein
MKSALAVFRIPMVKSAIADLVGSALRAEHLGVTAHFSMPRAGNGCAELVLLAEFRVVFHDVLHEALQQLLPVGTFHAAGHLGHDLGKCGDDLVAIDRMRLVFRNRVFRKEIIDCVDNQAVQARPFLVVFGVFGNGNSPRLGLAVFHTI